MFKSKISTFFRPWKIAVAFAIGAIMSFHISSATNQTDRYHGPIIQTFHTIPPGHRTLNISNFEGSLIWSEQELSGSPVHSFRKRMMPPIETQKGTIRVEIPFGIKDFFLEGVPIGNKPVSFKLDK